LISFVLRLASPIVPRERLREVINQLEGIGGGHSLGFGPNRVRSLPDGVAQALTEYLEETEAIMREAEAPSNGNGRVDLQETLEIFPDVIDLLEPQPQTRIGDLCPECGEAAVVNEEGCRKCYTCGFSEC
jgi:ribonucleoside-diphosphate reductase alpha chain